jgi:epoxide hydrolase
VREIRPFTVRIAQAQLDELRERLSHTRWPEEPPGVGWSSGAPLAEVEALVEYWRAEYDWREQEARLNKLSHGITTTTVPTCISSTCALASRTLSR